MDDEPKKSVKELAADLGSMTWEEAFAWLFARSTTIDLWWYGPPPERGGVG